MPEPAEKIDESVEVIDEENIDRELRTIREKSQIDENAKVKAEVRPAQMIIDDMDVSEESAQENEGPVDQIEPEMPAEKKKRKKSKGSKARKKKT